MRRPAPCDRDRREKRIHRRVDSTRACERGIGKSSSIARARRNIGSLR